MHTVTFEDIKANPVITTMVNQANKCLEAIGYTDHGPRHVGYVSKIAGRILHELGFAERRVELAKIAGWVHDVGNMVNRKNHGQIGASLIFPILRDLGMDTVEVCDICSAIGSHEEQMGRPVGDLSAALIIADKVDAYRARVRKGQFDPNDIHDRVNYAIVNTAVEVDKDKRVIQYDFTMNDSSSVMEFMQIYISRMMMCEESAKFLGCRFSLRINGLYINNSKAEGNNVL
jgi:metal-dependent HD superfamily phosphatase/phosphodiesterase